MNPIARRVNALSSWRAGTKGVVQPPTSRGEILNSRLLAVTVPLLGMFSPTIILTTRHCAN
jgi:hypothetical protein